MGIRTVDILRESPWRIAITTMALLRDFAGFSRIMETFAIGDVQGCAAELTHLLQQIDALSPGAQLVFVGDLVNRGPASLQTLRMVKAMGPRARTVLGNHDLHLLAVAHGVRAPAASDTLADILNAPDRDDLLKWLRHQPLALMADGWLVVHAGVLPNWSVTQVLSLAAEVERRLQADDWLDFLRFMYGNQPARWSDALEGNERLRCVVNALTRIRFCSAEGDMEFASKEGPGAPPVGFMPWFDVPGRLTADLPVLFGHWSTLGILQRENLFGLDSGCVWGGKLSALRLSDSYLLQVDCPQHQTPS
jgi:bis(5'-nucleosyl)-tetraphosphatase (symmetrical)